MKTTLHTIPIATAGGQPPPYALRNRIRQHFDADKDGKLNETERAQSEEARVKC